MTKGMLIRHLTQRLPHLSHKDVDRIVSEIFHSMVKALRRGKRVELRGFGTFEIRVRSPRIGRNPKSGEQVSVEKRRIPFFKVGKALRETVNHKQTVR